MDHTNSRNRPKPSSDIKPALTRNDLEQSLAGLVHEEPALPWESILAGCPSTEEENLLIQALSPEEQQRCRELFLPLPDEAQRRIASRAIDAAVQELPRRMELRPNRSARSRKGWTRGATVVGLAAAILLVLLWRQTPEFDPTEPQISPPAKYLGGSDPSSPGAPLTPGGTMAIYFRQKGEGPVESRVFVRGSGALQPTTLPVVRDGDGNLQFFQPTLAIIGSLAGTHASPGTFPSGPITLVFVLGRPGGLPTDPAVVERGQHHAMIQRLFGWRSYEYKFNYQADDPPAAHQGVPR